MKQRTRLMQGGNDLISNMNGYNESEGEVNQRIQLYRIKPQEHFIEAQVQEDDTLQAIALRFHCSISELKRINQIHKDNEIFAKRTIKVPVTPYSVLTELVPTKQPLEPQPSTSSHSTSLNIQDLVHISSPISQQNEINEPKQELALDCNAMILNSIVAPAVIPYTDLEQNDLVSEDTQLLPNKEQVAVENVLVKELTSHGADLGLKWFHLLGVVLVLGFVAPIVYVLFYLDKHEHSEVPPLHATR